MLCAWEPPEINPATAKQKAHFLMTVKLPGLRNRHCRKNILALSGIVEI